MYSTNQNGCPAGTMPYIIRAGDTFFLLAQRFGTTVAAIQAANPGVDPQNLQIGQRICIPMATPPGPCPAGTTPYFIRPGDTFFILAQRFGTTVGAIQAANPGVDPQNLQIGQRICIPVAVPPVKPCPPNTTPYIIQAGDTFFSLASRFNTTVAAIIAANPRVDPDRLIIGQRICIPTQPVFPPCPSGNYYTIRPGDTLFSIARRFRVSLDDLLQANPRIDPERLFVGQVICIPVAVPAPVCPPGSIVYTIRQGDTIYLLAQRYGVTVTAIIRANPGIDPDALLVGSRICIPTRCGG